MDRGKFFEAITGTPHTAPLPKETEVEEEEDTRLAPPQKRSA